MSTKLGKQPHLKKYELDSNQQAKDFICPLFSLSVYGIEKGGKAKIQGKERRRGKIYWEYVYLQE